MVLFNNNFIIVVSILKRLRKCFYQCTGVNLFNNSIFDLQVSNEWLKVVGITIQQSFEWYSG